MRVKLHGVSHDIRHLVVSSVIHSLHRVQYASLHGLQSVLDMRHGTLENHIGGIVEEPVLVHSAKMAHRRSIKPVDRLVVGMLFSRIQILWLTALLKFVFVFNFVAHR